jgi:RNA polymerase sigma-70 factor (ECF subfamily)
MATMAEEGDEVQVLLDRLRAGDQGALAELFARHREPLRRMIMLRLDQRLGGRVSPSDVLQETYVDALKRVPHLFENPDMPFFVWLRWIAGQRIVEVHRQHLGARMRDAGLEIPLQHAYPATASSAGLAAHLAAGLTSPSRAAIRDETLAQLEAALERLDPIDREVLALRHFEELSNNEVASLLGIQKAAASKRYVRALERLRGALAEIPGFFEDHV